MSTTLTTSTEIIVRHLEDAEGPIAVDVRGNGAGSYIHPTEAWTTVRHGGVGSGAWLARITGTHPTYRMDRRFVDAHRSLSRSGRSGTISWDIEEPGLYAYGRFCGRYDEASGYFVTDGERVAEVTKQEAEEIAAALEAERA